MADEVVVEKVETKVPAAEGDKKPEAKVETNIEGDEEKKEEVVQTEEQKEQERLKQEAKTAKQTKLDKRFKELTGNVKALKENVNSWVEILEEATGEPAPKRTDYKTDAEHNEAMNEYKDKIRNAKLNVQKAEKDVGKAETLYVEALGGTWEERITLTLEDFPDYKEVVSKADMDLTPTMQKTILRLGPQVAYALAKDPELAQNIFEMSPEEQILELGALNSKVQTGRKVVPAVEKEKVAPNDPPKGAVKGDKAPAKKELGDLDYEAFRKARGFKK